MALSVVSTPLDPLANSYASVADADAYATDVLLVPSVGDAWVDLDPDMKARYLVNATRILDSLVDWIGDRYSRDQKLDWPRSNAYIENFLLLSTTVPEKVQWATIEMAIWLMKNDGATSQTTQFAIDKLAVGPIRVDFNEQAGGPGYDYLPDEVVTLLEDYGDFHSPRKPGAMQAKTVRLVRA